LARSADPSVRAGLYTGVVTHSRPTLVRRFGALTTKTGKPGRYLASQVKDVGSRAQARPGRESLIKAVRRREVAVALVGRLERSGQ
jgi:hypothetical protein